MNYLEWADEYFQDAVRVQAVMKKKKLLMNDATSAEQKKKLGDDIKAYRRIYRELLDIGDTLRRRAGGETLEA